MLRTATEAHLYTRELKVILLYQPFSKTTPPQFKITATGKARMLVTVAQSRYARMHIVSHTKSLHDAVTKNGWQCTDAATTNDRRWTTMKLVKNFGEIKEWKTGFWLNNLLTNKVYPNCFPQTMQSTAVRCLSRTFFNLRHRRSTIIHYSSFIKKSRTAEMNNEWWIMKNE